jgi:branched-chain amino acid transport system substrate-binding protein
MNFFPFRRVIKIGHVGPTSGDRAPGQGQRKRRPHGDRGAQRQGRDDRRQEGQVRTAGRRRRADPKQGTAAAQKLVDSKVNGVIGHLNSGTTIPASKIYSDAGIPQISPSATNPKYTRQGYKTTFRVVADDVHLGGTLGKYAVTELKGKSIAVIDDRTAYGQGVADEFEKGVKAAGGTVVGREFTTDKATDFTAILTSLKAKKPDIVFFGGMDAVAGPMLRQMKQLGIKAKFMGGDGICSGELPKLAAGTMADGQVVCAEAGGVEGAAKVDGEVPRRLQEEVQRRRADLRALRLRRRQRDGRRDGQKAGSAEPAKYLPELAKTDGYKGVTGTIAFDEKGDIKNGALTLYTYKGGKREQIAVVR